MMTDWTWVVAVASGFFAGIVWGIAMMMAIGLWCRLRSANSGHTAPVVPQAEVDRIRSAGL